MSIELPVTSRHRRDMTDRLLKATLSPNQTRYLDILKKKYERSGRNLFCSIKNSDDVFNKLKSKGFRASILSYDFSTLYTTLPYNLIKEKLTDLIESTFKGNALLILLVMTGMHFYF